MGSSGAGPPRGANPRGRHKAAPTRARELMKGPDGWWGSVVGLVTPVPWYYGARGREAERMIGSREPGGRTRASGDEDVVRQPGVGARNKFRVIRSEHNSTGNGRRRAKGNAEGAAKPGGGGSVGERNGSAAQRR